MGDTGLGFAEKIDDVTHTLSSLQKYNDLCEKLDINLYIIRGNHDASYDEIWNSKWTRVFLIKNSAVGIFPNGRKVLFISGGISVDRCTRVEGFSYWKDEITPYLEDVEKTDFVFSHDAPEYFNHSTSTLPNRFDWAIKRDPTLIEDCIKQRNNMSDIVERSGAKVIFSGHFHNAKREEKHGIYYRCLDINERFEFDANKQYKL